MIFEGLDAELGGLTEIGLGHGAIFQAVGVICRIDVFSASWVEIAGIEWVNDTIAGESSLESVWLTALNVVIFVMGAHLPSIHPGERSQPTCVTFRTFNVLCIEIPDPSSGFRQSGWF